MFDVLKKKPSAPKPTESTEKPQGSKMTSLRGKDLATQEAALKPTAEPKAKGPSLRAKLGGLLGSARDSLQAGAQNLELGILKKLMPDEKAKEYWQLAKMTTKLPLDTFLREYRSVFVSVATTECSLPELQFREAVDSKMAPELIFSSFIAIGAPNEINIPGAIRRPLAEQAEQGDFKSMDFTAARAENTNTMSDTYLRLRENVEAMRGIFTRLSGLKAPAEIDGTFGSQPDSKGKAEEGGQSPDAALMKKLHPDEEVMEFWAQAKAAATGSKIDPFLQKYRDAFVVVATKESSLHEFEFREAVQNNMSPELIYKRFIEVGAPGEINVPGKVRNPLIDLAKQGDFSSMDFKQAFWENTTTLTDTYGRVANDDEAMRIVFTRLAGYEAPAKIDGTF